MEKRINLYDMTVSTGNPLYVVSVVFLKFNITEEEILQSLKAQDITPKGLVFDNPDINRFTDAGNSYRIELYMH